MKMEPSKIKETKDALNKADNLNDAFAVLYTMLEQKYTQEEIEEVFKNTIINHKIIEEINEIDRKR